MLRIDNAISGVHAKGACYLCHSGHDLVDTEVTIDYEGVLAICRACVHDMAMTAGWDLQITTKEVDALISSKAESDYIADSVLDLTSALTKQISDLRKKHRDRLRQYASRTRAAAEATKAEIDAIRD